MHRIQPSVPLRPRGAVPLPRIGIIGGGQLAKMTASAAAKFGCEVVVLERQEDFPAHSVDTHAIVGDWDDPDQLMKVASLVDVVTLENEFVSLEALGVLERAGQILLPRVETMSLVQDKLLQKRKFQEAGIPMVRFADAPNRSSLMEFGFPAVLKRRRNSYDGKGNATLSSEREINRAWERLDADRNPVYVESQCPFERELAIIVTRGLNGDSVQYPVVETINREHICHVVRAPGDVPPSIAEQVKILGLRAVEAIDGVGSFGLEFFLLSDQRVLLNEIAPRVHNTGHYTIEACVSSQFENHVRAVLGWPLGDPSMVAPAAAMVNLLGFGAGSGTPLGLCDALKHRGAHVHIYGKSTSTRGRKMGHVTALGVDARDALEIAQRAADCIHFGGEP